MPNIMITNMCNLNCPYCFANEFVNKTSQFEDMSEENFKYTCEFFEYKNIGIIGGEPTLHPKIKNFLKLLKEKCNIRVIFTNGILIDTLFDYIKNTSILLNFNSPKILRDNYDKVLSNIDYLFKNRYNLRLGLNIYTGNIEDYSYFFDTVLKYNQKNIRLSLCVPNTNIKREMDPIEFFQSKIDILSKISNICTSHHITFNLDCNYPPPCFINLNMEKYKENTKKRYKNIFNKIHHVREYNCRPVIDILPNLEVARCFGLSQYFRKKLTEFKNIHEIKKYFIEKIDKKLRNYPIKEECLKCDEYNTGECYSGCLAFRSKYLLDTN